MGHSICPVQILNIPVGALSPGLLVFLLQRGTDFPRIGAHMVGDQPGYIKVKAFICRTQDISQRIRVYEILIGAVFVMSEIVCLPVSDAFSVLE